MPLGRRITDAAVKHHAGVTWAAVAVTLAVTLLAGVPTVLERSLGPLRPADVDTDPENMLAEDEPVRVFHNKMKEVFSLHDMVVVGVVNEQDPRGVFNVETLGRIHELTRYAQGLRGRAIGRPEGEGVIDYDVLSLATVDKIESVAVPGRRDRAVSLTALMRTPPSTQGEADGIRRQALRVPLLSDTIVSTGRTPADAGKAAAIYLPITRKDLSHTIYTRLRDKIATFEGPEEYHITGLPVAEDTFGVEMFVQMAISAPAAMGLIFLLMLAFFRKLVLILSPMIVALMSVVLTMGALVIAGLPIHIMSSMIPIFIMPIAVLDSIHIISEFFERYQATRDRRKTLRSVMDTLFVPMLYTSLTSAAGFASLALTPIPPVQVFGVFVAMGIMAAWLLTVTFIPAYVMFIDAKTLERFGAVHDRATGETGAATGLARFLRRLGRGTYRRAKPILAVGALVFAVAIYGITRINVNDNPIRWFTSSHPIRKADDVLNRHFGGTYMAYLALSAQPPPYAPADYAAELARRAARRAETVRAMLARYEAAARTATAEAGRAAPVGSADAYFDNLRDALQPAVLTSTDEQLQAFKAVLDFMDAEAGRGGERKPFDKAAYLADADQRIKAQARAVAEVFATLPAVLDRVAATEPADREEFLDRFAAVAQAADPDAPIITGEEEAAPTELPAGGEEPPPPPGGDEPPLPELGGDEPPLPEQGGAAEATAPRLQLGPARRIAWKQVSLHFIDEQRAAGEVFKRPEVLSYIAELEAVMRRTAIAGKSNSIATIAKTIHRDLLSTEEADYRLPSSKQGVGQCFTTFQNSSPQRREDLWHFTTRDFRRTSVWVQLVSGDNEDMSAVKRDVAEFMRSKPPPPGVSPAPQWFGLTNINVEWQQKMVWGMMQAFAGSFLVVLLLMTILFRSPLWGLLSMVPLTVTITAIYGTVGLVGKDYDMPVAVLSALTLGLAVDFAIHFLARARAMHAASGSWAQTAPGVFGEPARAIARNIIVIAAGFTPLLLAPLVPYRTVGVLMATILLVSGVGTLLLLPALLRLLERRLFVAGKAMGAACNCALCAASSILLVVVIALNFHPYTGWNAMTWLGLTLVPVLALACGLLSRREKCRARAEVVKERTDEQADPDT
jgi:predicted RND superfamily exporter protein